MQRLLRTEEPDREQLPMKGYGILLGLFGVSFMTLMGWARRRKMFVEEIDVADLIVLGVGSHKLARIITKDRITTVLRQPFTVYEGTEGALPAEVTEHVRRDGGEFRAAVGELLTCPYCASTWSTTALFGTYLSDRKLGRTIGMFFSLIAVADIAQKIYHDILD
ncbi:MAG: DUF1360 domain-containing protein [Bradymonadaceae bacterium]